MKSATMSYKFNSLAALVCAALCDRVLESENFLDLFADDAVLEYPFAPEGTPERLEGKAAIARHALRLAPLLEFGEMTLGAVYNSGDTVIFESSCQGRGVEAGVPYNQDYISVITLRGGRIVRYQDYWNPLVLISAMGGQEKMAAAYAR